jgi:hypothetical protein
MFLCRYLTIGALAQTKFFVKDKDVKNEYQ